MQSKFDLVHGDEDMAICFNEECDYYCTCADAREKELSRMDEIMCDDIKLDEE